MKNILSSLSICFAVAMTSCNVFARTSAAVEPTPSQPSQTIAAQNAPASTVDSTDFTDLLNGKWLITSVGKTTIEAETEEEMPYVYFDGENHAFYASNGCNILNGAFLVEGNKVTFANILSTMKYCKDVKYDIQINEALADGQTRKLGYQKIGHEGYVYLMDGDRRMMVLRRHGMDFLNGNWRIIAINNEPIEDEEANIFFDIDAHAVHGNTGCNYFNGEIIIEPTQSNAVSFEKMGVTKRMCQKLDQERKIMLALESVTTAYPNDNGTALLTDSDRMTSVILRRIPIER